MRKAFLGIALSCGVLFGAKQDQFKDDFLRYIKFLQALPQQELLSPQILEDVAELYNDGQFRDDVALDHAMSSFIKSLASKASHAGVSYHARQFVADLVADHATHTGDPHAHIQLQHLINAHASEQAILVAKQKNEELQMKMKKERQKQVQRASEKTKETSQEAEEPAYFMRQTPKPKAQAAKIVRAKTPRKKKVVEAVADISPRLKQSGTVTVKTKLAQEEKLAIPVPIKPIRRAKKISSESKPASPAKRVRKKSS